MNNKLKGFLATGLICILLVACGTNEEKINEEIIYNSASGVQLKTSEPEDKKPEEVVSQDKDIDLDLTQLSSTMVYSEVYNILTNPTDYIGKIIRMEGSFSVYVDEDTGNTYFACIIADATACCSQGIEFVLSDDFSYPEDYPETGEDIIVTGTFETYEEKGVIYARLGDACLKKNMNNWKSL